MHFSELRFKDFRGFADETLVLGDRMTVVLAGPNGCGKSSVLAAAGSLASAVVAKLAGDDATTLVDQTPTLLAGDRRQVRTGCDWGLISGRFIDDGRIADMNVGLGDARQWHGARGRYERSELLLHWIEQRGTSHRAFLTQPLLAYLHSAYARKVGRLHTGTDLAQKGLAAYQGAFDQEAAHFDDFEAWFEAEENIENEAKIRKGDLKHQHPPLRAVRSALHTFLTELRGTSMGRIEVVRTHVDGPLGGVKGRLTVAKADDRLFLDQLSDGERRLIVLVGDVARRMAILNPHMDRPTDSPGILLADEIDLHLHPGWQRRVMPALRATFAKVQLIVTTHSPQVLASVDSEAVVLMKDFKFLPGHPKTRGRDSNTLLNTVFEVPERPEEVQAELRELYEALEDHPRRARTLFKKLRARLEEDDPELARVETLLAIAGG